jgi:hypothetical protein
MQIIDIILIVFRRSLLQVIAIAPSARSLDYPPHPVHQLFLQFRTVSLVKSVACFSILSVLRAAHPAMHTDAYYMPNSDLVRPVCSCSASQSCTPIEYPADSSKRSSPCQIRLEGRAQGTGLDKRDRATIHSFSSTSYSAKAN